MNARQLLLASSAAKLADADGHRRRRGSGEDGVLVGSSAAKLADADGHRRRRGSGEDGVLVGSPRKGPVAQVNLGGATLEAEAGIEPAVPLPRAAPRREGLAHRHAVLVEGNQRVILHASVHAAAYDVARTVRLPVGRV